MSSFKYSHCCISVFCIIKLCAICVAAESKQQQWASIHPLCNTAASYGSVLVTYLNTCGLSCCISLCQTNDACLSCVYDDAIGECSLNSAILTSYSTCGANVKYVQMASYKCVTKGVFRICHSALFDTTNEVRGYVEAYVNGVWGSVCNDKWQVVEYSGNENAQVLCKSMGYSDGIPWDPEALTTSIHTGPIVMDNAECTGTESNLLECSYISNIDNNCGHDEDIRVICYMNSAAP